MKALVIGGNGFIGSHLTDKLLEAGDQVRVFDLGKEKFRPPLGNVEYFYGDFSNTLLLRKALQNIDTVYHLLSSTIPQTSNKDPQEDVKTNLIGTIGLLNEMKRSGNKKIIFLSSGGTIYGNPEKVPVDENAPLKPKCSYGIVKMAIEKYLLMYNDLYDISPLIFRPSNPFGHRQSYSGVQGVISAFLFKTLKKEPLTIWGSTNITKDYIYVEDLAKLLVKAGHSAKTGIYNAGSGIGTSLKEIIDTIAETTNYKHEINYKERKKYDIENIVLDNSRAIHDFNWLPETSFKEGIIKHWHWLSEIEKFNLHDSTV